MANETEFVELTKITNNNIELDGIAVGLKIAGEGIVIQRIPETLSLLALMLTGCQVCQRTRDCSLPKVSTQLMDYAELLFAIRIGNPMALLNLEDLRKYSPDGTDPTGIDPNQSMSSLYMTPRLTFLSYE